MFRQTFSYINDDGILCIGFKNPKRVPLVRVRYRTITIIKLPIVRVVRERDTATL